MLAIRPGGPDAAAAARNTNDVVGQLRAVSDACKVILANALPQQMPTAPPVSDTLKAVEEALVDSYAALGNNYVFVQEVARDLIQAAEAMRRGVPQSIVGYANLFLPLSDLILKWLEQARTEGSHPDLVAAARDVIVQLVAQADQMAGTINEQSTRIGEIGSALQKAHDGLAAATALVQQRFDALAAWEQSGEGQSRLFLDKQFMLGFNGELTRSLDAQTVFVTSAVNLARGTDTESATGLSAITDARTLWGAFADILHQLADDLGKAEADLNLLIEEVWVRAAQGEWADLRTMAQGIVDQG